MPITKTYSITDLLSIGRTIDLTNYRTSITDNIGDIEYTVSNIYDDYMDELMEMCVEIRLSDEEYSRYRMRPKLLSHKLYNTTDLAFILAKVNNVVSDKDFDFRVLNVVRPDMLENVFSIYQEERKYIRTIDSQNILSIDEDYYSEEGRINDMMDKMETELDDGDIDIGRPPSDGQDGEDGKPGTGMDLEKYNELLHRIKKLEEEINDLSLTILEIIENMLVGNDDLEDIINNLLDLKIEEKLNDLTARVEELENYEIEFPEFPEIVDDRVDDILIDIEEIFDRLSKLEEGDIQGATGITTRDVVFNITEPLIHGVVLDSEFMIPYKGTILHAIMSVNAEHTRQANVILEVQRYDVADKVWNTDFILDLDSDVIHDIFPVNKHIDNSHVRIRINAGDMEDISKIGLILIVLEDSIAEELKSAKKKRVAK